ncbi:chromobox protein homolog 1 isoform X2 [Hermetia illucens]|uniref:chromobox protein homolog 1 isoform X2 n=1 Tax=Hermetia illucens TaxID=343691 RepID=UPI0018CC1E46|nr:chromobox protein homolog 1 isoform X2 [Hermetia illucens]
MRKLSAKKKVKKARGKDEDAAATPDSNVDLEVNENGGKNDESSDDESDNSKTVKRKSRKNAGEKKSNDTEPEDEAAEEEKKADDADEGEDEEGDEEYEVQDIVDEKQEKGVTYYLIRWKGYGPEGDTWEPEDTLNCDDIVARFKKKKTKGSSASGKSKKSTPTGQGARKRKAEEEVDDEPSDPEKEWEVERIVDVGYEKGVRLFRVRWKGYRPKFDTWEPEEHLNCRDLVEKFMEKMEDSKKLGQKELREKPKRTQRFGGDSYRRGSKRNAGRSRTVYYEED